MSARDMAISLRVWAVFGCVLVMSDDVLAMLEGCFGSWWRTGRTLRGCSVSNVGEKCGDLDECAVKYRHMSPNLAAN